MSLSDDVVKAFAYLFDEYGFAIIENEETSPYVVIAQSGNLRLRFIKDRADFFLDVGIASIPGRWVGFYETIEEMKKGGRIAFAKKYTNKMAALSAALRETFPSVKEWFEPASARRVNPTSQPKHGKDQRAKN